MKPDVANGCGVLCNSMTTYFLKEKRTLLTIKMIIKSNYFLELKVKGKEFSVANNNY